jgi:biopolymer transport protein ExbD
MAEVNNAQEGGSKKGKRRSKKMSTKVDMTPMVDLAFLLITFFMLTTSFGKPQAMEVKMPDKSDNTQPEPLKESKAFTVLLGEDNKVYYYQGLENPTLHETNFSSTGIRQVLLEKSRQIKDMVVLIKAEDKTRYKNMVDILDEMHITNIQRFAIVDITDFDKGLILKNKKEEK